MPLWSGVEAAVLAAVPQVTGIRLGLAGRTEAASNPSSDLVERISRVLDDEIVPAIAAHRGGISLVGVDSGLVSIRLHGGCQGCSLAAVTVQQGIEPILRARIPEVVGVVDLTDHEAGTEPFFAPSKR
jgi:Fe-S cluster biogenesis protein NfuA